MAFGHSSPGLERNTCQLVFTDEFEGFEQYKSSQDLPPQMTRKPKTQKGRTERD